MSTRAVVGVAFSSQRASQRRNLRESHMRRVRPKHFHRYTIEGAAPSATFPPHSRSHTRSSPIGARGRYSPIRGGSAACTARCQPAAWWRLLLPRARHGARQRRRRACFGVARLRYRVGTRCSSAALRARAMPRRAPTDWCRPMQRSRRRAVGARCRQAASSAVGRHTQREREANAIRGHPGSINQERERERM